MSDMVEKFVAAWAVTVVVLVVVSMASCSTTERASRKAGYQNGLVAGYDAALRGEAHPEMPDRLCRVGELWARETTLWRCKDVLTQDDDGMHSMRRQWVRQP